jgi:NDP-sugar pyrophosphorylase family protein
MCQGAGSTVKATALAAGKGTRLFPLTGEMPKPLVPALDKPIIQHVFDLLATQGVEEVNVRHPADAILDLYGEGYSVDGMTVSYCREEELMVTAGGIRRLADTI